MDKRWVTVRTMTQFIIECIETTQDLAQGEYVAKCEELQAEGWVLEGSKYDWQFAHRGNERIFIGVESDDPYNPSRAPSTSDYG